MILEFEVFTKLKYLSTCRHWRVLVYPKFSTNHSRVHRFSNEYLVASEPKRLGCFNDSISTHSLAHDLLSKAMRLSLKGEFPVINDPDKTPIVLECLICCGFYFTVPNKETNNQIRYDSIHFILRQVSIAPCVSKEKFPNSIISTTIFFKKRRFTSLMSYKYIEYYLCDVTAQKKIQVLLGLHSISIRYSKSQRYHNKVLRSSIQHHSHQ